MAVNYFGILLHDVTFYPSLPGQLSMGFINPLNPLNICEERHNFLKPRGLGLALSLKFFNNNDLFF